MPVELPTELAELVEVKTAEVRSSIQQSAIEAVDSANLDELRAIVKQLLVQQARPAAEPLGVDAYEGLPVFFDKPECPRCKPFAEPRLNPDDGKRYHVCNDCNGMIPASIEFFSRGVESVTVDHLHLHTIKNAGGQQIRVPARRELCIPCFRIDWAKVHPEKPCDL